MEWSQALEKWREAQAEAEAEYGGAAAGGGGFYVSAAARGGKHTAVLCVPQRARRPRKDAMLQVYRYGHIADRGNVRY